MAKLPPLIFMRRELAVAGGGQARGLFILCREGGRSDFHLGRSFNLHGVNRPPFQWPQQTRPVRWVFSLRNAVGRPQTALAVRRGTVLQKTPQLHSLDNLKSLNEKLHIFSTGFRVLFISGSPR